MNVNKQLCSSFKYLNILGNKYHVPAYLESSLLSYGTYCFVLCMYWGCINKYLNKLDNVEWIFCILRMRNALLSIFFAWSGRG